MYAGKRHKEQTRPGVWLCRSCFGKPDTLNEERDPNTRPPSRANLAAQQELDTLAETRQENATRVEHQGDAAEDEDDREGRPLHRIAFRLGTLHMPSITKRFQRLSRQSRDRASGTEQPDHAFTPGTACNGSSCPEGSAAADPPVKVPAAGGQTLDLAVAVSSIPILPADGN